MRTWGVVEFVVYFNIQQLINVYIKYIKYDYIFFALLIFAEAKTIATKITSLRVDPTVDMVIQPANIIPQWVDISPTMAWTCTCCVRVLGPNFIHLVPVYPVSYRDLFNTSMCM